MERERPVHTEKGVKAGASRPSLESVGGRGAGTELDALLVLAGTWVPDEGPALHTALGSSGFRVRVMFCGVSESDSEL